MYLLTRIGLSPCDVNAASGLLYISISEYYWLCRNYDYSSFQNFGGRRTFLSFSTSIIFLSFYTYLLTMYFHLLNFHNGPIVTRFTQFQTSRCVVYSPLTRQVLIQIWSCKSQNHFSRHFMKHCSCIQPVERSSKLVKNLNV